MRAPSFGVVAASADDVFEASLRVREQLEPIGYRLLIAGARRSVWPSGMAREMGGFRVYLLDEDRVRAQAPLELVETFGPAGESEVVSVEEQRAYAAAAFDGHHP